MPRYSVPENIDDNREPLPGLYHVFTYEVNDSGQTHKGTSINGVVVAFKIVTGTVKDQEQLTFRDVFWNPEPEDPEKFKRDLQKIIRFYEVLTRTKVKKGGDFDMNWAAMKHKHLIIRLENYTNKKGETKLVVGDYGRGYYDVKDPAVEECPVSIKGVFERAGKASAAPAADESDFV